MSNGPQLKTFASLVTTFTSFLTVAIHTILYERGIYPASTFLSARKYNYPVRQNRHPKVCRWINDAVAAVEAELLKGTVSRVAVVIYSASSQPLERFLFDLSSFPQVPPSEILTEFEDPSRDGADGDQVKTNPADVEEQLRGIMRRLAFCGSSLGRLPDGCSFTVCVELKDQAEPPIGHPQPWIPSQPSLQPRGEAQHKRIGANLGGVRTTPVRTIEAGEFALEMWIEESKAKVEAGEKPPTGPSTNTSSA